MMIVMRKVGVVQILQAKAGRLKSITAMLEPKFEHLKHTVD